MKLQEVMAGGNPRLNEGTTEVWFKKDETWGAAVKDEIVIDPADLELTHVLLANVQETEPERVYRHLQAHNWTFGNSAKKFLETKGVDCKSMTIGDVIVVQTPDERKVFLAVKKGFIKIREAESVDLI